MIRAKRKGKRIETEGEGSLTEMIVELAALMEDIQGAIRGNCDTEEEYIQHLFMMLGVADWAAENIIEELLAAADATENDNRMIGIGKALRAAAERREAEISEIEERTGYLDDLGMLKQEEDWEPDWLDQEKVDKLEKDLRRRMQGE